MDATNSVSKENELIVLGLIKDFIRLKAPLSEFSFADVLDFASKYNPHPSCDMACVFTLVLSLVGRNNPLVKLIYRFSENNVDFIELDDSEIHQVLTEKKYTDKSTNKEVSDYQSKIFISIQKTI